MSQITITLKDIREDRFSSMRKAPLDLLHEQETHSFSHDKPKQQPHYADSRDRLRE